MDAGAEFLNGAHVQQSPTRGKPEDIGDVSALWFTTTVAARAYSVQDGGGAGRRETMAQIVLRLVSPHEHIRLNF